ncbi:MAG: hypothetical protein ACLFU6_01235 [Candidatus Hydrogenedentota bacterium]
MDTICIVILLAAGAGEAEEARDPYIVTLTNNNVYYGFIEEADERLIRLELDRPWDPGRIRTINRDRIVSIDPESSRARERRIQQGWEALGREQVETTEGKQWLPREEVRFAERAREMARERFEEAEGAPADVTALEFPEGELEEAEPAPEIREENDTAPFTQEVAALVDLWGLHAAIVIAGLLAVTLTARYMILR